MKYIVKLLRNVIFKGDVPMHYGDSNTFVDLTKN